jgi:hypothetical protein
MAAKPYWRALRSCQALSPLNFPSLFTCFRLRRGAAVIWKMSYECFRRCSSLSSNCRFWNLELYPSQRKCEIVPVKPYGEEMTSPLSSDSHVLLLGTYASNRPEDHIQYRITDQVIYQQKLNSIQYRIFNLHQNVTDHTYLSVLVAHSYRYVHNQTIPDPLSDLHHGIIPVRNPNRSP